MGILVLLLFCIPAGLFANPVTVTVTNTGQAPCVSDQFTNGVVSTSGGGFAATDVADYPIASQTYPVGSGDCAITVDAELEAVMAPPPDGLDIVTTGSALLTIAVQGSTEGDYAALSINGTPVVTCTDRDICNSAFPVTVPITLGTPFDLTLTAYADYRISAPNVGEEESAGIFATLTVSQADSYIDPNFPNQPIGIEVTDPLVFAVSSAPEPATWLLALPVLFIVRRVRA